MMIKNILREIQENNDKILDTGYIWLSEMMALITTATSNETFTCLSTLLRFLFSLINEIVVC